jgi:hypothetical protein
VIVVTAFESPAIVTGLDDVTVMGQPVEQRGGHLGVAESASFRIRRTTPTWRRTTSLATAHKYSQAQIQDPKSSRARGAAASLSLSRHTILASFTDTVVSAGNGCYQREPMVMISVMDIEKGNLEAM